MLLLLAGLVVGGLIAWFGWLCGLGENASVSDLQAYTGSFYTWLRVMDWLTGFGWIETSDY